MIGSIIFIAFFTNCLGIAVPSPQVLPAFAKESDARGQPQSQFNNPGTKNNVEYMQSQAQLVAEIQSLNESVMNLQNNFSKSLSDLEIVVKNLAGREEHNVPSNVLGKEDNALMKEQERAQNLMREVDILKKNLNALKGQCLREINGLSGQLNNANVRRN